MEQYKAAATKEMQEIFLHVLIKASEDPHYSDLLSCLVYLTKDGALLEWLPSIEHSITKKI